MSLGVCLEIHFLDTDGNIEIYKPGKRAMLCTSATGKGSVLWVLTVAGRPKKYNGRSELFERFHSYEADTYWIKRVPSCKRLSRSRRVHAVVYRSSKWTGKATDYIHTFDNPPIASAEKFKNPGFIRISGGKIRVKAEGITG